MANLLRAGLLRLRKSKVFWCCLILAVAAKVVAAFSSYAVMISGGELWPVDRMLFLDAPVFVMICALFCGLFEGTEYRNGGIRGRIMAGSSRRRVYLSDFILCAFACVLFWLSGIAVGRLLGIPFFGKPELLMEQQLSILFGGIFLTVALVGVFYFWAMMFQSRIWGTTVCLLNGAVFVYGMFFLKVPLDAAGICSSWDKKLGTFCMAGSAVILLTSMAGIYFFWRKDIE